MYMFAVVDCGPIDISHANITQKSLRTTYMSEVTFSCLDEYQLESGETTAIATCNENGVWEHPSCQGSVMCRNKFFTGIV